jgi:hypothetical protein
VTIMSCSGINFLYFYHVSYIFSLILIVLHMFMEHYYSNSQAMISAFLLFVVVGFSNTTEW